MTTQQKAFADAYLQHNDAQKAALKAGYHQNTSIVRLLLNPQISQYLEQHRAQAESKFELKPDRVLRELANIAFANINNYYHPDGRPKKLSELSPAERAAIDVYEVNDVFSGTGDKKQKIGEKVSIKLYNKMAALDKLARAAGMHTADFNTAQVDEYEFIKYIDPEDWDFTPSAP